MEQDLNSILEQQLRGLHMPEAVSWWPPAPGWWVLTILVVLLIALGIWFLIKTQQNNRYRKQAISELEAIREQWLSNSDNSLYVQSANAVIKRAMVTVSGNSLNASLTGKKWIEELAHWSTKPLAENTVFCLAEAGYKPNPDVDIDALHKQLLNWLRTHRKPKAEAQKEPNYA